MLELKGGAKSDHRGLDDQALSDNIAVMRENFNKGYKSKSAKYQEIIRESIEFEQFDVARDSNFGFIKKQNIDLKIN